MNRLLWPVLVTVAIGGPAFSQASAPDCGHSTVAEFSQTLQPKAEAFRALLKSALKAQDKRKVAGMVRYPLVVTMPKSRRQIRTSAQFTAEYDRPFTASIRKAIEEQTPACLFANRQGVMIGNGEVWFEEQSDAAMKIKTLNIP